MVGLNSNLVQYLLKTSDEKLHILIRILDLLDLNKSQILLQLNIILYKLYHTSVREKEGTLFGCFLIGLFSIRFIVEFMKESQGGIETFLPGLSTGQWLSIPFIITGIIFLFIKKNKSVI